MISHFIKLKPAPALAPASVPAPAPAPVPAAYCGPPQLKNTLLTFDLSLEKHWRLSDSSFLRWWLHAGVLLPRTLPKFSTLGPPVYKHHATNKMIFNCLHISECDAGT